ncbi:hypothetical protein ACP4OV_029034 [Aristida adscensionis]
MTVNAGRRMAAPPPPSGAGVDNAPPPAGDGADADADPPAPPPAAEAPAPAAPAPAPSSGAPECPLPAGGGDPGAGPSKGKKRGRRAARGPSSSSSASRSSWSGGDGEDGDGSSDDDDSDDELGELFSLQPLLPPGPSSPAARAARLSGPGVWPMAFGGIAIQGRLREMEDTLSLRPALCFWADGSPMHFFAVFDGHGGPNVSALCRDQMHVIVAQELATERAAYIHRRQQQAAGAGSSTGGGADEDPAAAAAMEVAVEEDAWRAALRRSFRRVDALAAAACACGRASRPPCRCRLARARLEAPQNPNQLVIVGSTAVAALLVRDRLVVANAGDSRAVLARAAADPPIPLSYDHKPDRPDELARIMAVGGRVVYNNGLRVRGILAMTRAIGDGFLRPEVISEPDITITRRTAADECLVLASDGLWDALSNKFACDVARQCLVDHAADAAPQAVVLEPEPRCNRAAALLARLALCRGSEDNITAVVVDLKRRGMAAVDC